MCKKILIPMIMLPILLATSCAPKEVTKKDDMKIINVKMGEPMNLVKNTDVEPNLSSKIFDLSDEIQLTTIFSADAIVSRKKKIKSNTEGPVSMNGSSFGYSDKSAKFLTFRIVKSPNTIEFQNENSNAKFIFTPANGGWALTDVQGVNSSDTRKFKINPIHSSISKDNTNLSIMVSYEQLEDPTNRGISVFYFHIGKLKMLTSDEPQKSTEKYHYLSNEMYRWDAKKTLQVQVCSQVEPHIVKEIQNTVDKWSHVLNNRLDIKLVKSDAKRPFSDLNTRCINFIDGFLVNTTEKYRSYGLTFNIADQNTNHFIDGDILIFKNEFLKSGLPMENSLYADHRLYTFLHEMGHLLGLGHQFDGTDSIMSYNFNLSSIVYQYDKEAIQNLYPLRK